MKTGSFEAIGGEHLTLRNPISFIPFVSLAGLLITIYSIAIPSVLEALQPAVWTDLWLALILVWIALIAGFFSYGRLMYDSRVRHYEVMYVDQRDSGGELEIKYTKLGSSNQRSIIAKKVTLSLLPLLRTGGKFLYPVKGTDSSIRIESKAGKFILHLVSPLSKKCRRSMSR